MIENIEQFEREIKVLVAKLLRKRVDQVDSDADFFTGLGVDSILGVEILGALDKKFGIDIPENKLKDIHTLNDLIELVKKLKGKMN